MLESKLGEASGFGTLLIEEGLLYDLGDEVIIGEVLGISLTLTDFSGDGNKDLATSLMTLLNFESKLVKLTFVQLATETIKIPRKTKITQCVSIQAQSKMNQEVKNRLI